MSARLIAVSGLGPKEPAAFVVEVAGCRLLLDCGEGPEPGRLPDFAAMGRIDAIVLSHSHKDHVGALRARGRIGNPPVYATAPVLARLKDVAGSELPVGGRAQVLGVAIETGRNGHAPGGVWLRLATGDGLLYMGDYSTESPLYAFDVPPPTPTVIIDGSYGDAEEMIGPQQQQLIDVAARGPVLLPAPPDGRGPDIAIFLQDAGFDVAIDAEVRAVAGMLTQLARSSVRPESMVRLERLISNARVLDGNSPAQGAMVAHGASGDVGVAAALIKRWRDARDPAILFTGHLPAGTVGKALVESGRAQFQRWNVHPRCSDNLRLIETLAPRKVIAAFGEARHIATWRMRAAPREVVSSTPIAL